MSMHDDIEREPWTKAAGVWTIMVCFTFVAMLVVTIWYDGPIGKLWMTWLTAGVFGMAVMWCIAWAKEGP